jgi:hypothetical protein
MKMSDHVHTYSHFKIIDIEKPIYSYQDYDVVRVNKKYIDDAIHNFQALVITTPKGEKTMWPKQIKKEGKRVKEVFLRPDEPMVMFEIQIPHSVKSPIERWQI